jgi:DNA-binding NtrC family response regulator
MARILLVEDDLPLLQLYADALEEEHEVMAVDSAQGAIHALQTQTFDIIVQDMNLPDAPGTVILDYVQANFTADPLRVIVMSGFRQFQAMQIQAPVVEVLAKPVAVSTLKRTVNMVTTS